MTTPNPFAPPGADAEPAAATPAFSSPAPPYPNPPSPNPPYPNQLYPAYAVAHQPYPHQPYPHQPYPHQPYPHQPYPHQPYPHQPYPGAAPTPYGRPRQLPMGLALGSMFTAIGSLLLLLPLTFGLGGVVGGLVGLILGVVALRRVRAGTGGGCAAAWWGVGLSVLCSVVGVLALAGTGGDAIEEFQTAWEEAATPDTGAADARDEAAVDTAWEDGYDAGYEDGYLGVRAPLPAPGTADSPVDAADVPQLAFGEQASVGVYTVAVLAVSLDADDVVVPAFPGNVEPEGRYVLATVSVTNTGTEAARPAVDLYHYYPGDDDLLYGDWTCSAWTARALYDVGALAPGESAEYDVCFDVPTHSLGTLTLMIDDGRAAEYRLTQWAAG